MIKVLILHPSPSYHNYNAGDFLTFLGGKYLLSYIYEDIQFIYFDWERAKLGISGYLNIMNYGNIDIIALIGIPGISCHKNSFLNELIYLLLEKYPKADFITLGVGQGYGFPPETIDRFIDISEVDVYKGFKLMVVRDYLSYLILKQHGINSVYFYDISVFAYEFFDKINRIGTVDKRPLSIFLHYPGFYLGNTILDIQLDFIKNNDPLIITPDMTNRDTFCQLYGIDVMVVGDLEYLAKILSRSSKVMTTRVHKASLGNIMGADVSCIAIDMRYLTLCPFDINIINPLDTELWIPQTNLSKFEMSRFLHGEYHLKMLDIFREAKLV